MIDIHPDEYEKVMSVLKHVSSEMKNRIDMQWGLDINVPMLLEAKVDPLARHMMCNNTDDKLAYYTKSGITYGSSVTIGKAMTTLTTIDTTNYEMMAQMMGVNPQQKAKASTLPRLRIWNQGCED